MLSAEEQARICAERRRSVADTELPGVAPLKLDAPDDLRRLGTADVAGQPDISELRACVEAQYQRSDPRSSLRRGQPELAKQLAA
jgi:hypothetical protein